jgi:hypothetical protein
MDNFKRSKYNLFRHYLEPTSTKLIQFQLVAGGISDNL